MRRDISRVIRQVRPQRVVCQSPERNWERIGASHPDHLRDRRGRHCARSIPTARNPFAHPELLAEGLEEWSVAEVWINAAPTALLNHWVDITDTFDRKVAALRAHVSQTDRRRPAGAAAGLAGRPGPGWRAPGGTAC